MTCCSRGVCPDPQPFSFNTNGTLNGDGTGSGQLDNFWTKDTSYLRKALVGGIAGREGTNVQVVVSAVITAIKTIFGAAIDALQHTFKTFGKTIALLPYSFFWLSAAETPKATPFDMLCEVPKHALKAAVSAAMVVLAPIPAALNPSMTLRVTEAIHLTPAPIIARRVSPLPSITSAQTTHKARVEQGRLQKVAHICSKALWKPMKRLAFWPLGMAKQHPYIATTLSVATAIGAIHLGLQQFGYESPLTTPLNVVNDQWNQAQLLFWDLIKGNVTNSDEANRTSADPTSFEPTGDENSETAGTNETNIHNVTTQSDEDLSTSTSEQPEDKEIVLDTEEHEEVEDNQQVQENSVDDDMHLEEDLEENTVEQHNPSTESSDLGVGESEAAEQK